MVLKDRVWGYQLAEIEKTLTYERNDVGYVRPISEDQRVFYLDPSPFLHTTKKEVYIAQSGPPPLKGDLVEVSVADIEDEIFTEDAGKGLYSRFYKKTISGWKRIDPNSLAKSKKLLDPFRIIEYFTLPYLAEEVDLEGIGLCSALSFLSSPPVISDTGGMNTAVFSDVPCWRAYRRLMGALPIEFTRQDAPYFYKISSKDEPVIPREHIEANIICQHPEKTVIHTPLTLGCKIRRTGWYQKNLEDDAPMVTGYLIDSLLFRPVLTPSLENKLVEKTYALQSLLSGNKAPCNIDIGTCIPRMAASIARMYTRTEPRNEDIDRAFNLIEDMVVQTGTLFSTKYPTTALFTLEPKDWRLYTFIAKEFGKDCWIPEIEVQVRLGEIRMTLDQYAESFTRLNQLGIVIQSSKKEIRLLEPIGYVYEKS
jgi:hypothetical protein